MNGGEMKTTIVLGGILMGALGLGAWTTGRSDKPGADYVLHEWGTFTTVSGSDGILLSGLEREEEHLPTFVYSHAGMENGTRSDPGAFVFKEGVPVFVPVQPVPVRGLAQMKGFHWQRDLRNVTVKMETPVIYFYTEEELEVDLRVGFKGGAISQWYPHRSEGELPPTFKSYPTMIPHPGKRTYSYTDETGQDPGCIDFAEGYEGWIRWEVDVLPRDRVDPAKLFKAHETRAWMYPKVGRAAVVRNELGEYENYLFYRGVGNFGLPVKTMVDEQERLLIRNEASERVPFAFVFEQASGVVRYSVLENGIAAGETVTIAEEELVTVKGDWTEVVYLLMRDGLVRAGLYPEEADGMVRTWWESYFETPGLRVFWVVPEGVTNGVLPMDVTPAPRESVRVLVGRSEVLRRRFEQQLVKVLTGKEPEGQAMRDYYRNDRFGLAYQRRVEALTKLPETAGR